MDDIIIGYHDPCKRSQEYGVSVHESDESLDTMYHQLSPHEIGENILEVVLPSEDLPRAKRPSTQKRTNDLTSLDVDIPRQEDGHIVRCAQ